jgi:hypothetical protein
VRLSLLPNEEVESISVDYRSQASAADGALGTLKNLGTVAPVGLSLLPNRASQIKDIDYRELN